MGGELFTVPEESRDVVPAEGRAVAERPNAEVAADFISDLFRETSSTPNSAEKVALMRELIAMRDAELARVSREKFETAFAKMRAALPIIKKSKEVTRSSGQHMYNYAPLEEIQKQCDPILRDNGFAYAWREEAIEGGKRVWFDLFGFGHTRSNFFDAPLLGAKQSNSGGEIVNAVQAARMTSSYAKRNSMVDGLGLIIEDEDTDGATIEIDEGVQKIFDAMTAEKDIKKLLPIFQDAYKKYEKEPNKQLLISGKYAQVKAAIIQGGAQ
jgi:hypothetical protein